MHLKHNCRNFYIGPYTLLEVSGKFSTAAAVATKVYAVKIQLDLLRSFAENIGEMDLAITILLQFFTRSAAR